MKTTSTPRHKRPITSSRRLLSSLRNVLNKMETAPEINSLNEGEAFICPTCNIPVKLCMGNPDALCKLKLIENTELSLLYLATGSKKTQTHGKCLLCGKRLSSRQLKRNPLRELCPSCEARKVKRSTH